MNKIHATPLASAAMFFATLCFASMVLPGIIGDGTLWGADKGGADQGVKRGHSESPPKVAAAVAATQSDPAPASQPSTSVHHLSGIWVWRFESIQTPDARKTLLDFASRYGFNRLLIQIHFVQGSIASGLPQIRDPDAYRAILIDAAARGIRIEALDGGNDMIMPANQPNALAVLDALIALDAALPADARFAGVHYDIEPYLLPEWKSPQRPEIMTDYLTLLAAAREKIRSKAPHWTLSVDIPFWYGHKTQDGDSCVLAFHGQTKNFQEHIQDLTDYVGVMSYRRKAVGPNSIVQIVGDEMTYASRIGAGVCPSMEVTQLKETPTITFFGTLPAEFWAQKTAVEESFSTEPAFSGVLVHSYEHLQEYLRTQDASPVTGK